MCYFRLPLPVPVSFRVLVKGLKHDRQDLVRVVVDQIDNVLIVPVVQCSLRHLGRM